MTVTFNNCPIYFDNKIELTVDYFKNKYLYANITDATKYCIKADINYIEQYMQNKMEKDEASLKAISFLNQILSRFP